MTTDLTLTETPLVFAVGDDALVGVLTAPAGAAHDTALLVVVGGPQVRAGSHRHFVQLARSLAAQGHAVLRFDVRGMGDSSGTPAGFEHLQDDIAAALGELLRHRPEVQRVVLWGLCDGASAALLYLQQTRDPRIGGLVLLNPWVRSPETLARATLRHYYLQRLMQPGFWRKLVGGSVGLAAVRGWWHNFQTARQQVRLARGSEGLPFAARMAEGWRGFNGPILLVLSGDDVTAHEFAGHAGSDAHWRGALAMPLVQRVDLPTADHTFSSAQAGPQVLALTLDWLRRIGSAAGTDNITAR
jgi:exosortase A-associated hydrolase 1